MKAILLLATCIAAAAAPTNIVLRVPELAYVASLQEAADVTGPWTTVSTLGGACPHHFEFTIAPATNVFSRFYRVRLHDNGIEPTPEKVHAIAWTNGTSIAVDATLQFTCDDTQAGPTEFWRSCNDGEFVLIRTLSSPHFVDDALPPGTYRYKARIRGGYFCPTEPSVTLP